MKTPSNFEDPHWNPLQNACCGIQEAACDSLSCSVSLRWFLKRVLVLLFKIPGCRLFHRLNWSFQFSLRCRGVGNSDAPSGKSPELVSVFIEASKSLIKKVFLKIKMQKNLQASAHIQKLTWFLRSSKKLFISWHCPFKLLLLYV